MKDKVMTDENIQHQLNHLMESAPSHLQDNEAFKKTVVVFLKIGGIRLAGHYIKIIADYPTQEKKKSNEEGAEAITDADFPELQSE